MSKAKRSITSANHPAQGQETALSQSASAEPLERVSDDLESLAAKLDSLQGAFSCLASMKSGRSEEPLFYMLMNHAEELRDEANAIVEMVYALKRGEG